jgi:hypothetical protein
MQVRGSLQKWFYSILKITTDWNTSRALRVTRSRTLKVYRELAQKDPETYLSHVAITLNNLVISALRGANPLYCLVILRPKMTGIC